MMEHTNRASDALTAFDRLCRHLYFILQTDTESTLSIRLAQALGQAAEAEAGWFSALADASDMLAEQDTTRRAERQKGCSAFL